MFAQTFSGTIYGIDGVIVTVEVDISNGLPHFEIVGLGGSAVKESRDRVRSALRNSGFTFPMKRITVNLAPADMRKEGSGFDLAIGLGVLLSSEQVEVQQERIIVLGELALDGTLRPVTGVLPIMLEAQKQGFSTAIVPWGNAAEAALVDINICPVRNLQEALERWKYPRCLSENGMEAETGHCKNTLGKAAGATAGAPGSAGTAGTPGTPGSAGTPAGTSDSAEHDFADVLGQQFVKRGLEVAAAGFHNVLLIGPPGSGKTMLANCLPTIMPELRLQEAYDSTKIYSITGHLVDRSGLITRRPFRAPHHTITQTALIGGGGSSPRPGECSLAHNGILFLDEMPEYSRHVLEVLRQPMEAGKVTIGRARHIYTYPARFLLVGSMNPCPCGYYLSPDQRECSCTPQQVQRYRARISGPLLDRIDLHLEVPRVPVELIGERSAQEASASIRVRVKRACDIQSRRFSTRPAFPFNSAMTPSELRKHVRLDREGKELLQSAFHTMKMSARSYDRILKVSRTIADLEGSEQIQAHHIAEAIRYRTLDRALLA